MAAASVNFEFLDGEGEPLRRLAALGEAYFASDPNASLVKVRQFGELLAQEVAARLGVLADPGSNFSDVLGNLGRSGRIPRETLDLFHITRASRCSVSKLCCAR